MKKLGLTLAAIGLFFTAAQAQVEGEVKTEVEVENELVVVGDEFEKMEVSNLPETVTSAIITEFPEAITTDAFVKQDDEKVIYKVKLDIKGKLKKVYLDADGNWIKMEDKKEESN